MVRETSPRPKLRPEGFGVSEQTERMLEPEGDPVSPTEVMKTGLTEEVMGKAQDYVDNPPPEPKKDPLAFAAEKGYVKAIKGPEEKERYISNLNVGTEEGNQTVRQMFENILGKNPDWDPLLVNWCATFVSDVLDNLGADPLKTNDKYDRLRARKFVKYGSPVERKNIQQGDIVVLDFPRDSEGNITFGPGGKRDSVGDHVTFYVGDKSSANKDGSGYIGVLGGNQGYSSEIGIAEYPEENILAVRRITYDDVDYEFTEALAKDNPNFKAFLKKEGEGFDFESFANPDPMTGFNQGGAVMNEQIEMAFMAEGGLKDDGLSVDPVSGNDIPNGSLAEEVRDDIPAQLSEGEYVVPADVVRFYGVKFFEDLREEAKRGLADMEANGRIGGEPVPAGGPQVNEAPVTEQEMAALRELAMEMNVGGMVPDVNPNMQPPPQAVGNASPQQPQMMNKGGTVLGFQSAGDTGTTNDALSAVQSKPLTGGGLGFSLFGPYTNDGSLPTGFGDDTKTTPFEEGQIVELYKDGKVLSFVMMRDYQAYLDKIEEGWLTKEQKDAKIAEEGPTVAGTDDTTTTDEETTGTTDSSDDKTDYRQFTTQTSTTPPKNVADMTDDELKVALEGMNIVGRTGSTLAYSMGLPVGALVGSQLAANYNNMLEVARDRKLISDKEYEDKRKGSIFGGEKSIFDNLIDRSDKNKALGTSNKKGVDFGDTWLGDLLGFDGKAGVQGPGLKESFGGARRDQTAAIPSIQDTSAADNQTAAEEAMGRTTSSAPNTQAEKTAAAKAATDDWVAATQVAQSTSTDDPKAWSDAIKAQSEASKAATKAIQEASGWSGGFFGTASNPNWRDAAAQGGLMAKKKKKK